MIQASAMKKGSVVKKAPPAAPPVDEPEEGTRGLCDSCGAGPTGGAHKAHVTAAPKVEECVAKAAPAEERAAPRVEAASVPATPSAATPVTKQVTRPPAWLRKRPGAGAG